MTDLELTKACAEAMGLQIVKAKVAGVPNDVIVVMFDPDDTRHWNPLHDDAQAMALVKKFNLMVNWNSPTEVWCIPMDQTKYGHLCDSPDCDDLNRAIVLCVAKLKERP